MKHYIKGVTEVIEDYFSLRKTKNVNNNFWNLEIDEAYNFQFYFKEFNSKKFVNTSVK